MTVARSKYPGVVDHQKPSARNLDFITRHRDDRCGGSSHPQHLHGDAALVLTQQVVNGQTLEQITARAVDIDGHITLTNGAQRRCNSLCRNATAFPVVVADDIENADAGVIVSSRLDRRIPAV